MKSGSGLARMFRSLLRKSNPKSIFHRGLRLLVPNTEVSFDGCMMAVHPRDNYTEFRLFLDEKPYENETYETLMDLVRGREIVFFDIGANAGVYAVPVAVAALRSSSIVAFEPNPVLLERLNHNIRLNKLGNVVVHPVALGASNTKLSLNFKSGRHEDYGRASLVAPNAARRGIEVDVRMLKDFVPTDMGPERRSILKIDVEGYEDRVLMAFLAECTVQQLPNFIVIEVAHEEMWESPLRQRLTALGYHAMKCCDGNEILEHRRGHS